jgi:hypothetical protein
LHPVAPPSERRVRSLGRGGWNTRSHLEPVHLREGIFEKVIAGSTDYESTLKQSEEKQDATASAIYEHVAIKDIHHATKMKVAQGHFRCDA